MNEILRRFLSTARKVQSLSTRHRLAALLVAGALLAAVAFTATSQAAGDQDGANASVQEDGQVVALQAQTFTTNKPKVFNGDLRELPIIKPLKKDERPEPQEPEDNPLAQVGFMDAIIQRTAPSAPAPAPSSSFMGLDFQNWGAGWPPDTNGDVGPNHYIQTVNTSIGIYRKTDGTRLAAFTFNQFFSQSPTGTPCDNNNQGDPVALYDALSDRWIVTDFAWSNYTTGAMYQCMAVSQTSDPVAGGWYFYAFQVETGGKIHDYPKLGVWPDGIYMSANVFSTTTGAFQNVQVWAFDRVSMESGGTANFVSANLARTVGGVQVFSLLPSNARNIGSAVPAGKENYFVGINGSTQARVWKFHVDWVTPANSTFTGPTNVTLSTFGAGPSSVPEKQGNNVDTLAYRLMMQNQYQNLGGTESLWLTHTIAGSTSSIAAVRWYQLNITGSTIPTTPVQQSTWAPDTKNRFMPSLAVDKGGNMAIGYTVSDATMFPSLRYAGRLATDTVNTLGQGETSLIEGTGFQCCTFSDGSTNTRYGDYSTMSTDPDGCTFWFTSEYFDTAPTTLAGDNWKTRIGSFKYSQCVPNTLGTLQGTVTDAVTGNPIAGAVVTFGIRKLRTDANGFYQYPNLPTGTYTVNVSATGYSNSTTNNVTVSSGATTTQNVQLSPPSVNTTLAVSSANATYGGTTTLTATLTQTGGGAVSGKTITFTLNSANFANNAATTNASGVATLTNVSLAGINAGTYANGVGASFAGGSGLNASSGSNSLTVNQAMLTVKADDQTRSYGEANPTLTYTMTGFAGSDTQANSTSGAPSLTTTATSTSPAGTYPITITAGTLASNNYTFSFTNGTLTVTAPANYTISGQVTKGNGGIDGVTMTLSGSQSGTTQTDANGNYSFTLTGGGNYTITPSKAGYNFRPASRSFTSLSGNQTANFTASKRQTLADFDGDGKTDVAVYRPNDDGAHAGQWYIRNSADNSFSQQKFGAETDVITPGDFDGDGKTDIAVFRPDDNGAGSSAWYISKGSAQSFDRVQWGATGDVPVAGDYDGDGKTDIAVFRPSNGTWYILKSSDNTLQAAQWGFGTDRPVAGDYDGDGMTDIAVFRPSDGIWYILQSTTGTLVGIQWGLGTDRPVPGDFDGDSITDIAVFRPSDGTWYILKSTTGGAEFYATQWGLGSDVSVAGDYDGDGRFDIAVFRPSEGSWYILQSSNGSLMSQVWGLAGDKPTPSIQPGE